MATEFGSGGHSGRFPPTRHSAFDALGSDDPEMRARSLEILAMAYWRPVYKHVRVKWQRSSEDARELTQDFFVRVFEKRVFDAYDPQKGRFRTFLRTCLDRFLSNETKARRRLKRGGGKLVVAFDFDAAESELAGVHDVSAESAEAAFEREWVAALFRLAVDALRSECERRGKLVYYAVFERYVLADGDAAKPSYAEVAKELGLSVTDVTNYLSFARREFRRLVVEHLRAITASDEEFQSELSAIGGA